jgi:hypothetical protein
MADAKLFEYYERQDVLPTFGNFKGPEDLRRYAEGRVRLFNERLMLPVRSFADAELLEFGPDSGENALVFAQWGANLTLSEPNEKAHGPIRNYFSRFDLQSRLRELVRADIAGFRSARQFDIIDAEGFIYTIQPSRAWLSAFAALMKHGAYGIISYYERYGGLSELMLKAFHCTYKALTGKPPLEAAAELFRMKWDSIPHTRGIASWVMDVLENPFVRAPYFLDAAKLLADANAEGFAMHSAWPVYADPLVIEWHKKDVPLDVILARNVRHVERSRLSFALGRKLYLAGTDEEVARVSKLLRQLVIDVDALVGDPLGSAVTQVVDGLRGLRRIVETGPLVTDGENETIACRAVLSSLEMLFSLIERRDTGGLRSLAATNEPFIQHWGLPAHFLVLRLAH